MNQQIFYFFYNLAHKNSFLDLVFIFFATYLLYVLVAVFAYMLMKEAHRLRKLYYLFLALLSSIISLGIVTPIIRFFYYSPRPFTALADVVTLVAEPASSSLPSGHMMFTVPLALCAFYLNPRAGRWFLAGAVLMGIARIIAGVHWPADILAGIILGASSFYLAKFIFDKGGLRDRAPHSAKAL